MKNKISVTFSSKTELTVWTRDLQIDGQVGIYDHSPLSSSENRYPTRKPPCPSVALQNQESKWQAQV